MMKETLFNIIKQLKPIILKQNTKYKKTIHVQIDVCYAVKKKIQGAQIFKLIMRFLQWGNLSVKFN